MSQRAGRCPVRRNTCPEYVSGRGSARAAGAVARGSSLGALSGRDRAPRCLSGDPTRIPRRPPPGRSADAALCGPLPGRAVRLERAPSSVACAARARRPGYQSAHAPRPARGAFYLQLSATPNVSLAWGSASCTTRPGRARQHSLPAAPWQQHLRRWYRLEYIVGSRSSRIVNATALKPRHSVHGPRSFILFVRG